MALKIGDVIYRSLEEQVRVNMENISALTDKVDNFQPGGEKVSITLPAGTSSGTLTDEQLAKLQENESNYIEMVNDKELYYLNDNGHIEGFLTYSHVGIENSKATIKTITITVSAKSFVIVTNVVPTEAGGGKLYRHIFEFNLLEGHGEEFGPATATYFLFSNKNTPYTINDFFALIDKGNGTGVGLVCNFSQGPFAGIATYQPVPYDEGTFFLNWVMVSYSHAEDSLKSATTSTNKYTTNFFADTVTEI